jgi:homoserine O-acetyltransferase
MVHSNEQTSEHVFRIDNFGFRDGASIDGLSIAYWTKGRLNADRSNAVFLCHGASGGRNWAQPFCRVGGAFDPDRWYLISADIPGGGDSSRASNDPGFPASYAIGDLTAAVAALVEHLEITSLRAFCGQSMGSLIGLDLASQRPDLVRGLALWSCGYRCDGYGRAVIEALRAILNLDGSAAGMRAAIAAYLPVLVDRGLLAGMSRSARSELVEKVAEDWTGNWRADELIARYSAVAECDLAAHCGGESSLAARIHCPVLFLPCSSDTLFPPAQIATLARLMPNADVRVLPTDYGHIATTRPPGTSEFSFFDRETATFLFGLPA